LQTHREQANLSAVASLKVSEIFQSVQGEGASSGELSTFLRLGICNLACRWCDTRYSWDFEAYSYDDEITLLRVEAVAEELTRALPRRLVVTGGEPLLQQPALAELFGELGDHWTFEVETNGTIAPSPPLSLRVDQWNVSPKLSGSGNSAARRLAPDALASFLRTRRAWLKFVVTSEADLEEADQLVAELGWPKSRVLLMPEAASRAALLERAPAIQASSRARGYGYSGRLHLELWDGRRGT
jgi:7-carboxy-7-deazaguanine synthase